MIKNYLFVYPSSNFQDISIEGINIFEYNGQEKIEDFFFTDEFIVLENKILKDKFNQAEKYINRHIGTWQRWLSSWQDEIGKYRDLKDIVFKISNWLKTKNISEIIFWTSAPHHVDTSLIEIAARLNNIKTLFFYYEEIFTGNYLPMYRKEFKFNYKLNKDFQAPIKACELYVRKFLTRIQKEELTEQFTDQQRDTIILIVNEIIKAQDKFGLRQKLSEKMGGLMSGVLHNSDLNLVASCCCTMLNNYLFTAGWNLAVEDQKPDFNSYQGKIFSESGLTVDEADFTKYKKEDSQGLFITQWALGCKNLFEENVRHEYGLNKSVDSSGNILLKKIMRELEEEKAN